MGSAHHHPAPTTHYHINAVRSSAHDKQQQEEQQQSEGRDWHESSNRRRKPGHRTPLQQQEQDEATSKQAGCDGACITEEANWSYEWRVVAADRTELDKVEASGVVRVVGLKTKKKRLLR